MTNERKQDERQEQQPRGDGSAVTDLSSQTVTDEQADGVRGGAGKVTVQDIPIVMTSN